MKSGKKRSSASGKHRGAKTFAVLVGLTFLATGCYFAAIYLIDNRLPNFTRGYTLYVYPDMTAAQVIDSIAVRAQTIHTGSLSRCAVREDLEGRLRPGKYRIDSTMTTIYTIRMLCNGWQVPQDLTLSGTIRTKGRLAQKISSQMMTDSATVHTLLNNAGFLDSLGFTPENVFALILPDTYEMYWTDPAEDIFRRFKTEYDRFWTQERLDKAAAQKLSRMEVSILASIVSGETLQSFEYPIIARVYLNRLRSGMLLQADPTVAYCFDYKLDRILRVHTKVDSPYNTYKYKGLPPAPINVPPKACLEAVLNPDNNKYIYFCASPDFNGTHRFAVTYKEHQKNAREFHTALTKRRAREATTSATSK